MGRARYERSGGSCDAFLFPHKQLAEQRRSFGHGVRGGSEARFRSARSAIRKQGAGGRQTNRHAKPLANWQAGYQPMPSVPLGWKQQVVGEIPDERA